MDPSIVFVVVIFILAISVHESAHAWVADRFGDPTARMLGRISLNPLVHVDIFGTVIFPVLLYLTSGSIFGWAKPVPVNVLNLRRPRRDHTLVSAAGPLSNLSLAVFFAILFHLTGGAAEFYSVGAEGIRHGINQLVWSGVQINVLLAVFNLIPIPPLDGGGILAGILPDSALPFLDKIQPFGFIILVVLMLSGVLWYVIGVMSWPIYFVLGIH